MAENFKRQFVTLGFALNNTMITIMSSCLPIIFGSILDMIGSETQITINSYFFLFVILTVISAIALIMSIFFIRETYCKSVVDFFYIKIK